MQQTAGFGLTITQLETNSIEVDSKVHNICSLVLYLFFGDFGAFDDFGAFGDFGKLGFGRLG
jgi:hypothetical protein